MGMNLSHLTSILRHGDQSNKRTIQRHEKLTTVEERGYTILQRPIGLVENSGHAIWARGLGTSRMHRENN